MILVFLAGCIESFDYEPGVSDRVLVIDGGVTNRKDIQSVRVGYTSQYGISPFSPVRGVSITLYENGVPLDLEFTETENGEYQFDGSLVNAAPGKEYFLSLTLRDGKTYRSKPEIMPKPVVPDSAYFKINYVRIAQEGGLATSRNVLSVYVNTPVELECKPAFLRWRVHEIYSFTELKQFYWSVPHSCYMWLEPTYQEIKIFSGGELRGGILKDEVVFTRDEFPDIEFRYRHYFNVSQYSLTRSAHEYWSHLKIVANPTGSFIDIPPAAVIGNMYNVSDPKEIVLGYFEVAAEEIIRVLTVPALLVPHYTRDPCREWKPFCYDCLLLPNSSYDVPDYW